MKRTFQSTVSLFCAVLLLITAVPFGVFAESGAQAGDVLYRVENGMDALVTADGYFVLAAEFGTSAQDYVQTVTYLDKSFHVQYKINLPNGEVYPEMRAVSGANAVEMVDTTGKSLYLFANGAMYEIPEIAFAADIPFVIVAKDGLMGVADKNGNLLIPCNYDAIDDCVCDARVFFLAHRDGGMLTDLYAENGTLLMQNLSECYRSGETYFRIRIDGEERLYFPSSGEMHKATWLDMKNGFIPYQGENGLYGYLNAQGEICVQAQYYDVGDFSAEGLAAVRDAETYTYSYINTTGAQAFPAQYAQTTDFVNGYAVVQDETIDAPYVYRLIDTEGTTVKEYTSEKVLYIGDFDGSRIVVSRIEENGNETRGIASITGEMVMPFTELNYLSQTDVPGVYRVYTNSGSELIYHTKTGQYYKNMISPLLFYRDIYALQDTNGKWAVLNADGDIVTPFIYDKGAGDDCLYLEGEPYVFTNDGSAYRYYLPYSFDETAVAAVKNADGSLSFLNLQTGKFLFDGEQFDVCEAEWGGRYAIDSFGNGKLMLKTAAGEYIFADAKKNVITARHTGFWYIEKKDDAGILLDLTAEGCVSLREDGTVLGYFPLTIHRNRYFLGYDEDANVFITVSEGEQAGTTRIDFIKGQEYNIDHIEICTPPKQTSFIEGANAQKRLFMDENGQELTYWHYPIDWQSAELKIVYTDGTSEIVSVDENRDIIYIEDNQSASTVWGVGTHTVPIYCLGQKTEVRFEVLENPIQSIHLVQMPTVTQYLSGQYANLDGAVLQINYKNGTVKQLPLSNDSDQSVYDAVCGCAVQLRYDWSDKGVVTVEYAGVETTAEFDCTEIHAESIEICGGDDTCLTITATLSDGSKLDMVCYGGDWDSVITDKGTFRGTINYDIETDASGKAYKTNISVSLFGVTSNTLATCRQLDAYDQFVEVYSAVDCFASDLFTFFGQMTKENADDLATVAFHMWESRLDEQALEHIQNADGTWSVSVPRAVMDTAAKELFGLEGLDWTLCRNYTAATETFLFPAVGGCGSEIQYATVQAEKGGWCFVCNDMTVFVRSDMTVGEIYFGARNALLGDVNGDGKVNAIDARWVLQASSGARKLTAEQVAIANVNGDDKVNAIDARWILQTASGAREL